MYEALIQNLRSIDEYDTGYAKLIYDAADAIEELEKKLYCQDITTAQILDMYIPLFIPRWIPVKEMLPEQFKPVLVYFNRNGCRGTGVAEYYHDGDTKVWRGCGFIPTHWMPLPKPPKEEE